MFFPPLLQFAILYGKNEKIERSGLVDFYSIVVHFLLLVQRLLVFCEEKKAGSAATGGKNPGAL